MKKTVVIMLGEDDRDTAMGIPMSKVKTFFGGLFGAPKNELTPFHPDKQIRLIDNYGVLCRIYRVLLRNHPELFGRKIKHHKGVAKDIAIEIRLAQKEYQQYLEEEKESQYELV